MMFTPGPWKVDVHKVPGPDRFKDLVRIYEAGGGHYGIAKMTHPREFDRHANARLIAKAPKLYEALKGIEWRGIYGGDLSCLFCYSFETDGHMEDCEWQALITSIDVEE